jgi:hypothetical protein
VLLSLQGAVHSEKQLALATLLLRQAGRICQLIGTEEIGNAPFPHFLLQPLCARKRPTCG